MKEKLPKQEFDLTDQWAQITGMELTEEQLNEPIDIVEHYKKKVEPKEQTKVEFGMTWD